MKHYWLILFLIAGSRALVAQTPVAVNSGSYASFPPASANTNGLYDFIFTKPIFVADAKKNTPIPTNDWWTDLVVSGKNAGLLWSYPMMVDPEPDGIKVFFPTSFVADGSNMAYGGSMTIKAAGYTPATAVAKDWSDWGVVMAMPDSTGTRNIDLSMVHGIPFFWFETRGINPEFSFEKGASYLTQTGDPVLFPTTRSFVIKTDGRYLGVHLDGSTSAVIQGQQFAMIDLGTVQSITRVKLNWEAAFASGYAIQVSADSLTWKTVFSETHGNGDIDDIALATLGRYLKVALNERGTIFAYSLWEMQVYDGDTLLSQNKPVTVSSTQGPFIATNLTDGNVGTRWASDGNQQEKLVLTMRREPSAYFVLSALNTPTDLGLYGQYAYNKPISTQVSYKYDAVAGKVKVDWTIVTTNLRGLDAGPTLQGFLPHLYANTTHAVNFTGYDYVTPRGTMKTAVGNTFTFTYNFAGILPSYSAPYRNANDASPYDAGTLFNLITQFAKKTDYAADTYYGGKDLVKFAKYTLMAKEFNHQAYAALRAKTREALTNWLTYTPGESANYFARYDRWGGLIGFNPSFGSDQFTDNHFHYGYFVLAAALYAQVDPDFLSQYGDLVKLVAKQYANWDKADTQFPYFRTFDPWIGHSYAGGTSSSTGNNQESSSEAVQSWIGLFLLGDMLNDDAIRDAGAFGYSSESYATLEYWFDWKKRNLPPAYAHSVVGILSNQGFAYATYFSGRPMHIHTIQYLPVNPGFSYLARDTTWAKQEYEAMLAETKAKDHYNTESDFGADYANVALSFRQLFDPGYSAAYMAANLKLPANDSSYIMNDENAGITYFYTHANQNLGHFSSRYHTNLPSSSVFEKNGRFGYAVAYNPANSDKTAYIYDSNGAQIATFQVPAHTLITYPALPKTGSEPDGCYNLLPAKAIASSGNPQAAIDPDPRSRWESNFSDPQHITVDLGVTASINRLTISWEVANARDYYVAGSSDSLSWDTLAVRTDMAVGNRIDTINGLGGNYRYIQVFGTTRNTPYGYSIYDIAICGTAAAVKRPVVLPAFVEAESFDSMDGVVVETTNDAGGGQDVGYIDTGDWMDYRVEAPKAGTYRVRLRVSSIAATGKIQLLSNSKPLATLTVPNTGAWQTYTTIEVDVTLPGGEQTLRISAVGSPFNVNWLDIRIPDPRFSLHIEAEDYSQMSGVQTESADDVDGGLDVGYIDAGDWMDYTVTIPQAGDYTMSYRVASLFDTGQLQCQAIYSNPSITAIPFTNGWQKWVTISTTVHFATAGTQTFRLQALAGGFNINWMDIAAIDSAPARPISAVERKLETISPFLYPNPAQDIITVIATKTGLYRITDLQGRFVKQGSLELGPNRINLSGFSTGMYLINVNSRVLKFLVNTN